MKRCSRCKEFKSLDCFSYDKNTKDNLSYACKECNRIRVKLWATNNKERKTEVNHNYNNTVTSNVLTYQVCRSSV